MKEGKCSKFLDHPLFSFYKHRDNDIFVKK